MLRAIGRQFAAAGHRVTVLSAQPSYRTGACAPKQASREVLDGMKVRRIALLNEKRKDLLIRGTNGAIYSVRLFLHVLFSRRYDLVMVSTFPPILPAFLTCVACKLRGCRFIYHCQDIHPEVSMTGERSNAGIWMSLLKAVDEWTCSKASIVVVLSDDMRKTLLDRSVTAGPEIRVINNFELPQFDSTNSTANNLGFPSAQRFAPNHTENFRVLFAGNLGRFQSLDTVVRAAALLTDLPEVEIFFMGDGVMLEELRQLAANLSCANISFIPYQNTAAAKVLMAQADFGLVTLSPGMHKVAYPSKTMTYLGAGCPLLVMTDPDSELAKTVTGEHLGLIITDSTPSAVSSTLREAYHDRRAWRNERSRLREYAKAHSSEQAVMKHWERLIASF